MKKIPIRDYPSQEFTVRAGGHELTMRWMYNTVNDRWSISVWVDDEECPRISGKKVIPGFDLFYGYNMVDVGHELWVAVKPNDFTSNWYDRLALNPQGAIVALLTPEERLQIINEFSRGESPC